MYQSKYGIFLAEEQCSPDPLSLGITPKEYCNSFHTAIPWTSEGLVY